jgi:hypothetical protein
MHRRDFVRLAGAGLSAGAIAASRTAAGAAAREPVQRGGAKPALMKVGT